MKGCPPVTVNIDKIVEAVKQSIVESKPEVVEGSVHALKLVPSSIKPQNFIFGYVTVPTVVNFATKLMHFGVPFKIDMGLSRGLALGATLGGTILAGGDSFLLGALLGQFPSVMDTLANVAVDAILPDKAKIETAAQAIQPAPAAATAAAKGLGYSEEEELRKLRTDLQRLSGRRPGVLVVR